jgi:hypothetical protein
MQSLGLIDKALGAPEAAPAEDPEPDDGRLAGILPIPGLSLGQGAGD